MERRDIANLWVTTRLWVKEGTELDLRRCRCSDHVDNTWTKFTSERVGRLFKNKLGLRI